MTGKIAVLVDAELHNELVLRTSSKADVTSYIEHALFTFLERTEGDETLWSSQYVKNFNAQHEDVWQTQYGNPEKGYHWQILFLPNGTRLKMTYRGRDYFAGVRHQRFTDGEFDYTPSEWTSSVANHTSRNAWRDIWVQLPNDTEWQLADVLRSNERQRQR